MRADDGHQRSDLFGVGSGGRVAESASGTKLPGGLFRRAAGEDPRRGKGEEQSGISGLASPPTGPRMCWALDRTEEGAKFWLQVMNEIR